MESLEIRALGPLEVLSGGQVVALGSPRQRAVLAVLIALSGETVSSDRLIEEIWADDQPAKASHSLQTYVSNLRRLIGHESIETRRPGYRLIADSGSIDIAVFDESVDSGLALATDQPVESKATLQTALSLWRGDMAFGDLSSRVELLRQEAGRLEEKRLTALGALFQARLALGEHSEVIADLRRLTENHPYREHLWALLMRALYGAGRQVEALSAYRTLRTRLVEELGVDPSPELQELEVSILNQTEALRPHEPGEAVTLPHYLSRIIGRSREITDLTEHLEADRLVTVIGPGGVGKTRLAVEAARRIAADFTDGVFFVDLSSVRTSGDVPTAIAAGLLVKDRSARTPEEAIEEFLGGREVLMVLDNCEHVADEVSVLVWHWLTKYPGLHVVATSQRPLDVGGERVFALDPMATTDDQAQPTTEAEDLFLARAGEVHTGYQPSDEERIAIRQVCRRLDGIPLAIELAAARTQSMTPTEISARLEDRFGLLRMSPRPGPGRHATLQDAVAWSLSMLAAEELDLFDHLSVLSGSFSAETAGAVATIEDDTELFDLIDRLVRRSLLQRLVTDGSSRFQMLETLRAYGRDRLESSGALDQVEERRAVVFARLAEAEATRIKSDEYGAAIGRIGMEMDNLRQAFSWALTSGRHDLAFSLTRPLWRLVFVGARQHLHEGQRWRQRLIEVTSDSRMKARLLAEQGFTSVLTGDQLRAIALANESLQLAADGDLHEPLALEVLAICAATNRETDRAIDLARRVIALDGDDHDAHGLEALAMAQIFGGQAPAAVETVEKVYAAARDRNDSLRRIRALALMGSALQGTDLERSEEVLDEAVRATESLGMDWDLAGAVMARSLTRLLAGNALGALEDLEWACRLTHEVGDNRRLAQTLEILGSALAGSGHSVEATEVLAAGASLRQAAGVAGSDAEEARRDDALARLRRELPPPLFAKALEWGQRASPAEAANLGASIAAIVRAERRPV